MSAAPQKAVTNLKNLAGFRFIPTFEQVFDRGRWDVVQFGRDFLDVELHPGQAQWVETHPWADERYLASGNRFGKTWVTAIKGLHHAFYQTRLPRFAELTHRYVVVNLSITLDMAEIGWDTAFTRALDSKLFNRFVIEDECRRTPFPSLVIGGGGKGRGAWRSEFWARSTAKRGKYLLGKDFDYVSYDEAARDPDAPSVRDDVLLMRLADRNGRIDYVSTGNFKNWYYKEFVKAEEEYAKSGAESRIYAQTGSSYDNPHIDHDKLARNEERMSEEFVRQNVYGGFADVAAVFQPEDVEQCYKGIDYPLPYKVVKDATYVAGIDWGRKEDETVIIVLQTDVSPARIAYARAMGGYDTTWDDIYKTVHSVHKRYNDAFLLIDSTSQAGDLHMETLTQQYKIESVAGYNFAGRGARKEDLITIGQRATQDRSVIWPYIPELYDQLVFYSFDDKHLDTDWVMAFCLACLARKRQEWYTVGEISDVMLADSVYRSVSETEDLGDSWERLANDFYAIS